MKAINLFLVVVIGSIFFPACATVNSNLPIYKPEINTDTTECILYVYRVKSMMGLIVKWGVLLTEYHGDEQKATPLENISQGGYIALHLKPMTFYCLMVGNHFVGFVGKANSITYLRIAGSSGDIECEGNDVFYKSCGLLSSRPIDFSNDMKLIKPATINNFKKEILDFRLIQSFGIKNLK